MTNKSANSILTNSTSSISCWRTNQSCREIREENEFKFQQLFNLVYCSIISNVIIDKLYYQRCHIFSLLVRTHLNLRTNQIQQGIRLEALVHFDLPPHSLSASGAQGGDLLATHRLCGTRQLLKIWHGLLTLQRHIYGHRLQRVRKMAEFNITLTSSSPLAACSMHLHRRLDNPTLTGASRQ